MIRRILWTMFLLFLTLSAGGSPWSWLGPEGGDARSLAYDPANPDRIYLGTMAGKLFVSSDGGATWSRLAHLGDNDYVLDGIAVDPTDSQRIYVAAWSVNDDRGDMFRSTDGGKSWQALDGVHGKSLRALALAPSNSREVVTVALDGVYRSLDGGDTWGLISPPHDPEIKNMQSVAIDPVNPDVIYVGTWHLPWRTADGGKTWQSIKKGIIDDSDVFSIIIARSDPQTVFASACSGIYKSEDAGAFFHKVQGMPFSARRTRVIRMDPSNPAMIYAGTTEGLWKSDDAGKSFRRMTPANVVVNGIIIDPRRPQRVLLATDRGGVLMSDDRAQTFSASNHGFSQRQVASLLVDRNDANTLYAGLLNDHEYGGVFVSRDAGLHWQQMSAGLDGRDVFSLQQTNGGALVAGTNRGIFEWKVNGFRWEPLNTVIDQRQVPVKTGRKASLHTVTYRNVISRSEMETRVNGLAVNTDTWYAATPRGLFSSEDHGESWRGGPVTGMSDFVGVRSQGPMVAAAASRGLALSLDSGRNWFAANLPAYITHINDLCLGPDRTLWIATRQGVFRSSDNGDTWEHVLAGLPAMHINSIAYDAESNTLYAGSMESAALFESNNGGRRWQMAGDSGWQVRDVAAAHGRLYVTTAYDGILTNIESSRAAAITASVSGASQ